MKFFITFFSVALLFMIASCNNETALEPVFKSYNFEESSQGWIVEFADYPVGEEARFELSYGIEVLPPAIEGSSKGMKISGTNLSDDLFMFAYVKIENLIPDQQYDVTISMNIASNALQNAPGIGGSPGGSVFLKVGTLTYEPQVIVEDGYYRTAFDTGSQSKGGEDMRVIGTIGIKGDVAEYNLISRSNQQPIYVMPNSSGTIYVIIGTDSGFEGNTTVYYDNVSVNLQPVSG